jgi:hypothetical protein
LKRLNFIPVTVNLTFENVDLNKILYAQKIRNLCNIGVLFDRLPVATVFFDYVAMICASQENGERKFSGFRVQLDGMAACNKIAVKWMVLWELAHV